VALVIKFVCPAVEAGGRAVAEDGRMDVVAVGCIVFIFGVAAVAAEATLFVGWVVGWALGYKVGEKETLITLPVLYEGWGDDNFAHLPKHEAQGVEHPVDCVVVVLEDEGKGGLSLHKVRRAMWVH